MRSIILLSVAAFCLLVAAGNTFATSKSVKPVQLTWEGRGFAVPAAASVDGKTCRTPETFWEERCFERVDESRKHPVVLFLHGCAGGVGQGNIFADLAVVVMPDSFARPGRISNCKPQANKRRIMRMRFEEIRFAMKKLLKLPWVDTSHIYLAGFSEGGAATALYSGREEFAGRIVLGWVCTSGDRWWSGIRGPKVPVLSVVGTEDPYHKFRDKRGTHCGMHFGGRPHSRSIRIKGAAHLILYENQTGEAIRQFIQTLNSQ